MGFGMGRFIDLLNYAVANPIYIILFIAFYLALFGISIWYSWRPKPGRNPFAQDSARLPQALVTDHRVRNCVIKQGFHEKRLPEKVDAIVIGSGIGGLTVANILARAGKRVLVLEQHDQAGGCCHTFIDKGFEFDVGIHYIGEMRNNTVSRLLINQMSDGQVMWEDLDDVLDMVSIGAPGKANKYPVVTGKGAWKESLLKSFPDEKKAIDGFFRLLQEVRPHMLGAVLFKTLPKPILRIIIKFGLVRFITKYFSYSNQSLKEVVDKLTDNTELKAVLCYSFGDYGTMPADTTFAMHAALLNHYMYGGSYPRGGASEFAFHLIPQIETAGGRVLVRAEVEGILVNKYGRANGVRVKRGDCELELYSRIIISNAGAANTFLKLLPEETASKSSIYRLLKDNTVKSGVGAMSLFVGLKGTSEELGLKSQNMWAFTSNQLDCITKTYLKMSAEEAMASEVPLLFISFPSTKDSTFNDRYPGKSVCTVVTLANWEWFSEWENGRVNKRGSDYDRIKNNIGDRMWEQVVAHYPQLKDKVEFMEVGSPVSNKYYLQAPRGEIYGLDHSRRRFGDPEVLMELRPETDIPGLYLTGQDVFSGGFMGAVMGGVLCASKILNRNLWQDLINLKKSIAKNK